MERVSPAAEVVMPDPVGAGEALRRALADTGDLAGLVSLEMLAPPGDGVEGPAEFVRRVALAMALASVAEGVTLAECLGAAGCSPAEYLEVSQSPEVWPALTGWTMGLIVAPRFPGIMAAASMAAMTGDVKAQGMFMELVQLANERSTDAALDGVRRLSAQGFAEELRGMVQRLDGLAEELGARDGPRAAELTGKARKAVSSGRTLRKSELARGEVDHKEVRDGS